MLLTDFAWVLPPVAIAITLVAAKLLAGSRLAVRAIDVPNERSMHVHPIPRIGGLAMMCAILPAIWLTLGWTLVFCLTVLLAVSFIDDLWGLSPLPRFLVQIGVAVTISIVQFQSTGMLILAVLVVAITWMTNLFNFMDGIDGLAGGMTAAGFFSYGMVFFWTGYDGYAVAAFVTAGAAVGFLMFNFPPARLYMGDAGSVPLGFAAATFGISGWYLGAWGAWFPVVVFWPFIADATFTLVRRLLKGKQVWRAHRDHYYQRLALHVGHKQTVLLEYALIGASCLVAMVAWGIDGDMKIVIPLIWMALFTAFFYWVSCLDKARAQPRV